MKKTLLLLFSFLLSAYSFAQTIVQYPQQASNYTTFNDGGGVFDNGTTELGMWANNSGNKQVVAWRNFTTNGLIGGTASTMNVGDSFTITVNATQAYGQIGISLLSNPS